MATKTLMGYREYAKYRGCALATVQRAIKDGRITDSLIIQGDRKFISVKMADELWRQNTDQARKDNHKGGVEVPLKGNSAGEEPAIKGPNYQQNRAIREAYAARMAKLNFERESGKLLDADKVRKYMFKIHSRARDALLNIPDKLGPKLAAETDIHKIAEMINKEIEHVCSHFSKGDLDI